MRIVDVGETLDEGRCDGGAEVGLGAECEGEGRHPDGVERAEDSSWGEDSVEGRDEDAVGEHQTLVQQSLVVHLPAQPGHHREQPGGQIHLLLRADDVQLGEVPQPDHGQQVSQQLEGLPVVEESQPGSLPGLELWHGRQKVEAEGGDPETELVETSQTAGLQLNLTDEAGLHQVLDD